MSKLKISSSIIAIAISILLVTVVFAGVFHASSKSISDNPNYNGSKENINDEDQTNPKPTTGFFLRLINWLMTILGLNDDVPDDDNDGNGGDNEEATEPKVVTKGYDFYYNANGDRMLRFYGVLEKTGTAGTGISNLEYCWTWFEYEINGVTYDMEPLMARGDNLPRTLTRTIYMDGSFDNPPIPSGKHQYRICSKNAAQLYDYGDWEEFIIN